MPAVCCCHGPTSHFHRYDTLTGISSMVIALWLQSIKVVDLQAFFTDTSTRVSSMVIALCLQSVAVLDSWTVHRIFQFSTRISSIVIALWSQSVAVMDQNKPLSQILPPSSITNTSTRISSTEIALCLQSVAVVDQQVYRYFYQLK